MHRYNETFNVHVKNMLRNIMQNKIEELETKCTADEDLTSIFDAEDSMIYFDVGHMGDKGNGMIAQKIFDISSLYISDSQE